MGNSLLDFVMGLVRDPEAIARFAADPDGVLAGAGLIGVTAADVNNLIPVVADSIAMSTPRFPAFERGMDTVAAGADSVNVWTSGAATAAFAAFDPVEVHHPIVNPDPVGGTPIGLPPDEPVALPGPQPDPTWQESPWPLDESQAYGEHPHQSDGDPGHAGFDLF